MIRFTKASAIYSVTSILWQRVWRTRKKYS